MQKISFPFGEFQNILVEQLYMCVEFLWKSERYELIADVNKPIIAVFEKQRDFKVCVLNPEVSDNSLHDIGELLIVSKIRNSLVFFWSASSSWTLSFLVSEIIRSLLWHSSVVSKSCRGGKFREAALWSLLSCGILWAGKFPTRSMASKSRWLIGCCLWSFMRHLTACAKDWGGRGGDVSGSIQVSSGFEGLCVWPEDCTKLREKEQSPPCVLIQIKSKQWFLTSRRKRALLIQHPPSPFLLPHDS